MFDEAELVQRRQGYPAFQAEKEVRRPTATCLVVTGSKSWVASVLTGGGDWAPSLAASEGMRILSSVHRPVDIVRAAAASACGHGADTIEGIVEANTREAHGRSCVAGIPRMVEIACLEVLSCSSSPAAVSKDA